MAKRRRNVREHLARERERAIRQLQDLGLTPRHEEGGGPRETGDGRPRDEGDHAQASERQDLGVLTRERLAERINRLTEALRRFDAGTYGTCEVCGERIEAARLEALPEATTCLRCQREREQSAA